MEVDPFNTSKPESDEDTESDSDVSSKKKKKSRQISQPNTATQSTEETTSEKPKLLDAPEALWKRLIGQANEEKAEAETTDETIEQDEDTESSFETELPLEDLSEEERALLVEQYVAARLAALEGGQAPEADEVESPAEQAARVSFLQMLRDRLAMPSETPAEARIQESYEIAASQLAETPLDDEPLTSRTAAPSVTSTAAYPVRSSTVELSSPTTYVETLNPETGTNDTRDVYQNKTGAALLLGGAVGYLVGRRRGRVQGEKALQKMEKSMTAAVEKLEHTIQEKEQAIKTLVREKAPVPVAKEKLARPEVAKEKLGLVSIKAVEQVSKSKPERPVEPTFSPEAIAPNPRTSARPELLAASESIPVGATNLRRVYETHLISEQGLRRLVEASRRGENIREILEQEMLEKELSYERDPQMRNRPLGALAASAAAKVLSDTGLPDPQQNDAVKSQKIRATKQKQTSVSSGAHAMQVAGYVTTVTLLVIIAVLLYLLITSN